MIFVRSIFRELVVTLLGVGLALVALLTTMQLAKLLGSPSTGVLPFDAVLYLLGFNLARYFPILMVLTLFITTLSVVLRSYRDHEMQIWQAAGLGLSHWYRPVLAFAVPIALGISLYTLVVLPHIEAARLQYQSSLKERNQMGMVAPGLFIEPAEGKQIYFVESLSPDTKQAQNVFIHNSSPERDTVIQSASAQQLGGNGEQRQIQLNHGIRYEYQTESNIRRLMRFDSLRLWLPQAPQGPDNDNWRTTPAYELAFSSNHDAHSELVWRLGWPISALMVCLLAIPLASHNPRGGRSYSMVSAVLIFLIYQNGMGLMEKQIERGHLNWLLAMLLTHAPALIAAALLMAWRTGWFNRKKTL